MSAWTTADIPSQAGKLAVITGTGGLGYETALALAGAGAEIVLAGRNPAKGGEAVARIKAKFPNAGITFDMLDLADLASVADFGRRFASRHTSLDLLVNNAAVMALPQRQATADGLEMQFGTNYLGHFALTAHLLPLLKRSLQPRVVSLSSLAHRSGVIDFADLQAERSYRPWKAYTQSKLAMLIFAIELQRRSDTHGWGLMSNAAHSGFARTDLIANGPGARSLQARLGGVLLPYLSHSAAAGALPTLFAATSPKAQKAGYYGPDGVYEMKGPPVPAKIMPRAKDAAVAQRLWAVSETLTKVTFDSLPAAA